MPFHRNAEGPPSFWDTHGASGKRFYKSNCVFISTLSAGIESMEFIDRGAAPFVPQWKVKGKYKNKIKRYQSGNQPKVQISHDRTGRLTCVERPNSETQL